ncbi:hypothetical protein LWI29_035063 [Acer saccharum]|uniref:Pectinesterase inhibitor domain-containing protein n=1 Tax=Acer saccharum TaxID=4024 RepID=A0AA39W536_ACESA|nr:hypothetical protein LWI29_035063 [Acer saccharum]
MASPPSNFSLFVLFLFFHCSFSMAVTTNAASQLINQVCSRTQNPDFCVRTLTSDPGANTADLKGLDHISLSLTLVTATETKRFIQASLENVTDSGVKQVLDHCNINYAGSVYALGLAITNLEGNLYHEVVVYTNVALENANDCNRVIKQGPPPPGLQDKNTEMLQFTDISVAIVAPGAANANLTTLASFSLKSTYAAVATTDGFLAALLRNVTDPRVKQVVTHCRTNYDGSILPLQTAITSLDEGHFDDVSFNVNQGLTNINDCDRVIKVGPPPPGLPEKSTHVVQLVDISGVISVMLLHQ